MKATDSHTQKGVSHRETDAALLLELEDGTEVWIPFSQIEHIVREAKGGEVEVTMSRWIAVKKGLV